MLGPRRTINSVECFIRHHKCHGFEFLLTPEYFSGFSEAASSLYTMKSFELILKVISITNFSLIAIRKIIFFSSETSKLKSASKTNLLY